MKEEISETGKNSENDRLKQNSSNQSTTVVCWLATEIVAILVADLVWFFFDWGNLNWILGNLMWPTTNRRNRTGRVGD